MCHNSRSLATHSHELISSISISAIIIIIIIVIILISIALINISCGWAGRGDASTGRRRRHRRDRPQANKSAPHTHTHTQSCTDTANLRTTILDFRGLDSSRILIPRGGILMSIGNFRKMLSQAILVRMISVGRLGVAQLAEGSALGCRKSEIRI